jgi:hypothetical protein
MSEGGEGGGGTDEGVLVQGPRVRVETYYRNRVVRIGWRCERCRGMLLNVEFNFCPWCGVHFVGDVATVREEA